MPSQKTQPKTRDVVSQVVERIRTSDNVLVALSKDPTVDELSAALGLTFILDKIGKRATAIFSGAIPNAIEFLEPEKTFEANTDSLQDFIIALDKEKADHLRYKIDGDYVKVFITPYKTTIDERDMEFSHGDYNVDLVISLNVSEVSDLDAALSEYGRIMHDATSINISAGVAGSFGDLEWGNPEASSVSEMVGTLADALKDKEDILDKPIATALLAGIVAATNRFSNERTTSDTMALAAKLMAAGADQQLISSSIPVEILTKDVVDANADFVESVSNATPVAPAVDANIKIDVNNPAQDLPNVPTSQVAPVVSTVATEPASVASVAVTPTPVVEPTPVASATVNPVTEAPVSEGQSEGSDPAPEVSEKVDQPEETPDEAETKIEEVAEPAPATDPTELTIRHGEVEFDPDEDLSPEERAKKDAERAKEETERAAREAEERKRRAPIEAAMAEITAKNTKGNPFAKPAAPATPAKNTSSETTNANADATVPNTTKSPFISTVKGNGESLDRPVAENVSPDASAEPKKKIMPIGDVLERKDEPKNYASMMEAELNPPTAPAPSIAPAPIVTPVEAPVDTPTMTAPTPLANVEAAVYVDPATVTPQAGAVLPPPPAPFVPDANAYMPPTDMQPIPTAQFAPTAPAATSDPTTGLSAAQIAEGIQATNPAVENTPFMNTGSSGYIADSNAVANTATEMAPEMPATNPGFIVGANPAPTPEAPADPNTFQIPGM